MSNADPGNFKKQFLCIGSPVRKVFKLLIYTQTSNMWHIFVEQYSMYYIQITSLTETKNRPDVFSLRKRLLFQLWYK